MSDPEGCDGILSTRDHKRALTQVGMFLFQIKPVPCIFAKGVNDVIFDKQHRAKDKDALAIQSSESLCII